MRTSLLLVLLLVLYLPAPGVGGEVPVPDIGALVGWMSGSFSSAQQTEEDAEYFDIRLEMVPIWTVRSDALWLYVEQAAADALDRPYRQRVYRLTHSPEGVFESAVYELSEPAAFVGAWRSPDLLDALSPGDLRLKPGCSVYLARVSETVFSGSTKGTSCLSTLRGAAYATSEVEVRADRMESWDRGFDAGGRQVWGAEKGPYVFRRVEGRSSQ